MQVDIYRSDFTDQELSILNLLRDGKEPIEIAELLGTGKGTIHLRTRIIRAKLRARTNCHAMALAIRYGVISNNGILK